MAKKPPKRAGWTLTALADRLGIPRRTFALRADRGDFTVHELQGAGEQRLRFVPERVAAAMIADAEAASATTGAAS